MIYREYKMYIAVLVITRIRERPMYGVVNDWLVLLNRRYNIIRRNKSVFVWLIYIGPEICHVCNSSPHHMPTEQLSQWLMIIKL